MITDAKNQAEFKRIKANFERFKSGSFINEHVVIRVQQSTFKR